MIYGFFLRASCNESVRLPTLNRMTSVPISSLSDVITPRRRSSSPSGTGGTDLDGKVLLVGREALRTLSTHCRNPDKIELNLSLAAVGGKSGKSVVNVNGEG